MCWQMFSKTKIYYFNYIIYNTIHVNVIYIYLLPCHILIDTMLTLLLMIMTMIINFHGAHILIDLTSGRIT